MFYLSLGMVAFRYLESENETKERLKTNLWIERIQRKFNISQEEMDSFVKSLQKAADLGYSKDWVERWSFTGSLFFSGTIITTIGKFMSSSCVV